MPDMMKQIEEAYKAFEVAEKREMSQKEKQNLYFGRRDKPYAKTIMSEMIDKENEGTYGLGQFNPG